ncbi:saccharopine dehydrogenase family protein [Hoeflea prorocentri]|uniref:Saccharopine dehydrogenase family protein n=1 Tax=Hoeflea prorocentri TaxID=1922333 RepID=A0A9X3UNV3_9HYPH|nr:saccharopine dehydrogenase family protein [Hoeflea prorocentri]MCY6382684.1 saccharopine dehydrogenase family protein [Hoeflea prorocentri]MDA5400484.1 saccharopine dehydrogenase family protein [Hoeflea prorocentri]
MAKPNLLIVGAGGVGQVTANKAVQFRDDFGTITLAARNADKLNRIATEICGRWAGGEQVLSVRTLDARNLDEMIALIRDLDAGLVLNVASSYCNRTILDACLETGANYLDTALAEDEFIENIEAPWYSYIEWPRRPKFAERKISAFLGMGFDPGVVNIFCAYGRKHLLDEIDTIDIIDVNAGSHGRYFATNFDADINLREIREDAITWEDKAWKTIPRHSHWMDVSLPEVGTHRVYSMGHDEIQSLAVNFPDTHRITFWMGFGEHYLNVFNVLDNLGLTSSVPVEVDGVKVAPNRLVKALLPDPASLAEGYTGKICIGVELRGRKDGKEKRFFIWSNCDHQENFREVGSQSISYSTGIPVITAARLIANGTWNPQTMVHVEELDPDPFMALMPDVGIAWQMQELPLDGSWPYPAEV